MKNALKLAILTAGALLAGSLAHATSVAYSGVFQGTEGAASYTGQATTATYTRDMNTTGDRVSMQINASTTTVGSVIFSSHNYLINTPTITITNSFTLALPVLLSTGAVKQIGGLALGTTYFAIPISPNTRGIGTSFKLSDTSTGAVAGISLVLTSTNAVANTYTLAPLPITGSAAIFAQWSDDNVTYFQATTGNYNAAISSAAVSGAAVSRLYDFGPTQHRYLQVKVLPPPTGAITYTVTDNERYSISH